MGADTHVYPPQNPPPYPGPPYSGPPYPEPGFTEAVTAQPGVQNYPGATIIITQAMGPNPAATVCRSCGAQITSRVERMPSMRTHLFAILLCLVGCWPCSCLPYCVDTCNNADHYCPNCNSYIGSYHGV